MKKLNPAEATLWFVRVIPAWYIFLFAQPLLFRLLGKSDLVINVVMVIVLVVPPLLLYLLTKCWKNLSRGKKALAIILLIQPLISFLTVLLVIPLGFMVSSTELQ